MTALRWLNSCLSSQQPGVCKGKECVPVCIDCVCPNARGHKTDIQPVILFTTPSLLSESLHMVMEDIPMSFFSNEAHRICWGVKVPGGDMGHDGGLDMSWAVPSHNVFSFIAYKAVFCVFFHLVFFLSVTVGLFCLTCSSCSLAHYELWVGWTCSTSGILPLQISLIIPY